MVWRQEKNLPGWIVQVCRLDSVPSLSTWLPVRQLSFFLLPFPVLRSWAAEEELSEDPIWGHCWAITSPGTPKHLFPGVEPQSLNTDILDFLLCGAEQQEPVWAAGQGDLNTKTWPSDTMAGRQPPWPAD